MSIYRYILHQVCHVPETKAVSWRVHGDCVVAHGDNKFFNVNILSQMVVGSPTPQRKDKSATPGGGNVSVLWDS